MSRNKKIDEYDASTVRQLVGLESLKKRPGMYIGSTSVTGVNTCLREVVDNSIDEFVSGVGDLIEINIYNGKDKIHPKFWTSVEDHGRGIPVGPHAEWKNEDGTPQDTLTGLLTRLHCGGKFGDENSAFKNGSSGLHGIGAKCITALSKQMIATVKRYGKIYQQKFGDCKVLSPVEIIGECDENDTGTKIEYILNDEVFKQTLIPNDLAMETLFDEITALNAGLKIVYNNEITKIKSEFYHPDGIKSYVNKITKDKELIIENPILIEGIEELEDKNIKVNICFTYDNAEKSHETFKTFANNVNTHDGGYHLKGFREALASNLNEFAIENKMINSNLEMKYIMENIYCIISVMLPEAEFEGQTKEKLGNQEVETAIKNIMKNSFNVFKKKNKEDLKLLVEKAIKSKQIDEAIRKARNAARASQKMSSKRNSLPGKLTDCSGKYGYKEIYICEGDSAGGAIKLGRFPKFQAVLPLRGKILNTEKSNIEQMAKSETIQNIVSSIGTGIGVKFDIKKIRYDKIIIATDADVDGSHIRILLLTLFYKYMKPIIEEGYVYASVPPLFRLEFKDKTYKYVKDDIELNEAKKKYANKIENVSRFKGLTRSLALIPFSTLPVGL